MPAHAAILHVFGGIVFIGGPAVEDAPRSEFFSELGILGIVRILRLLFGVEVIEVAEELVEAMDRRKEFVAVAQMVFSKLSGRISQRFHDVGYRRIFRSETDVGSRQTNFGQAGSYWRLSGYKCGAAGGTALLTIPVGEECAFFGDAVDIRRAVSHHAQVIGADVEPANVVSHDEKDVGLLLGHDVCPPIARRSAQTLQ